MKIVVYVFGKLKESSFLKPIEVFVKKINHYVPMEINVLKDVKNKYNLQQEEGKVLLGQLKRTDYLILLDNQGKEFDSERFAQFIEKKIMNVPTNLVFAIGGAFGFSESVYSRADFKLSLSQMTFTHDMARLIFMEQLYRAFSIIHNLPYHHA